jgi:hypothetical protein
MHRDWIREDLLFHMELAILKDAKLHLSKTKEIQRRPLLKVEL